MKNKEEKKIPDHWNVFSVIEIGAGLHNYYSLFQKDNYVAIDIDRPISAGGNSNFVQADARSLPFKPNSFDVFIASSILEHIEDPLAGLKDLNRICIKGGLVVVPVLDYFPFIYDPVNWIMKWLQKPIVNFGIGGFGHVSMMCQEDWKTIFHKAGFEVEREEKVYIDVFGCLEFFISSIFFSQREYVSFVSRGHSYATIPRLFAPVINTIGLVVRKIYSFLYALNLKTNGSIGVYFYLKKIKC